MIWQTSSTNSSDTERLGELLGKYLRGGEVIELISDLGGGKTTFVKGLAKGIGSQKSVTSPTFTLSQVYDGKRLSLHHFDFYRLDEPGVVADQLAESIDNQSAVTVVEWSKTVDDVLPKSRLSINFDTAAGNPDERQMTITYPEFLANIIELVRTDQEEIKL